MDEFKNMPASRKRLLALLGVVLVFAFYMLVINKPDSGSTPTPPAKTEQQSGGTEQSGETAQDGSAADPSLPADPTEETRPGETTEQQLPSRFPGTRPVVLVYNPFQTPDAEQ